MMLDLFVCFVLTPWGYHIAPPPPLPPPSRFERFFGPADPFKLRSPVVTLKAGHFVWSTRELPVEVAQTVRDVHQECQKWLGSIPVAPVNVWIASDINHYEAMLDRTRPSWRTTYVRDGAVRPSIGYYFSLQRRIIMLGEPAFRSMGDERGHGLLAHELVHHVFATAVGHEKANALNAQHRVLHEAFAEAVRVSTTPEDGYEIAHFVRRGGETLVLPEGRTPGRRQQMKLAAEAGLRAVNTYRASHDAWPDFVAALNDDVNSVGEVIDHPLVAALMLCVMAEHPEPFKQLLSELRRVESPERALALAHDILALADEATLRAWAESVLATDGQ